MLLSLVKVLKHCLWWCLFAYYINEQSCPRNYGGVLPQVRSNFELYNLVSVRRLAVESLIHT